MKPAKAMEELKAELENIVAAFDQERNMRNYTSDNIGDVYSAGVENGELYLAKIILEIYFKQEESKHDYTYYCIEKSPRWYCC